MRHARTRSGFTLVELLVVIGIIALLISILLPSLNKARQASIKLACASNLRQLGVGFVMYAQDNQGLVPYMAWVTQPGWTNMRDPWDQTLARYLKARDAQSLNVVTCPADAAYNARVRSYVMPWLEDWQLPSAAKAGQGNDQGTLGRYSHDGPQRRLVKARGGDRVLLLVEAPRADRGTAHSTDVRNPGQQLDSRVGGKTLHGPQFLSPSAPNFGKYTGFNYLFADAHVEFLDPAATLGPNRTLGEYLPFNQGWDRSSPGGLWTIFPND